MSNETTPQPGNIEWSKPINGLAGRLGVVFEALDAGLRFAVNLELRNVSSQPIAVINQPRIQAELFDSSGNPVSTLDYPMSGPIPGPQWAVIPRDAYVGFRVDMQTVGVPPREQKTVLLAVGRTWRIGVGKYVLTSRLIFEHQSDGPNNQWTGELELPPVEVEVTAEMVAVK